MASIQIPPKMVYHKNDVESYAMPQWAYELILDKPPESQTVNRLLLKYHPIYLALHWNLFC